MTERYPDYDILDKWSSVSFDDKTRAVLTQRLHAVPGRRFFTQAEWDLLEALSSRLAPTPERGGSIPITPWIDRELFEGDTEGFRIEGMPPTPEAWRIGLAAIEAEAKAAYVRPFAELDPETQDLFLKRIQKGEVDPALWGGMDAKRFFGDILLKGVVGVYYAHPQAQSEMGFGGPASPRGYVRIGLNEHDPWEAREVRADGKTRRSGKTQR